MNDSELLRAIQTGDEQVQADAKDELVQKYSEKLITQIVKYLWRKKCNQPTAHAKGVLNSTWIRVFLYISQVREAEKLDHWLTVTALNEAARHLRSCISGQIRSEQLSDDSIHPPARIFDYYTSKDAAIDVDRMLAFAPTISEEFGIIFRLYNERELGFDEIARRLGKKEEAVRTQYYRGFRKLRTRFVKKEDDLE